ncbi:MAG: hypothetical protein KAJ19_21165, partial [Gammaproteobacteria bacterium]|nr:hypothetical protein [Gammaproteobacteria bacterium]
ASSKGWIDRGKVAESFDRAKKLFKDDENAVAILTAIDKRKADFIKGHAPFMTAQKAQKMKIGLNKDLKNAFGEIKRDTKEGSKALRRSLRIELEKMNPALHNLNRKHRVSMLLDKEIDNAVTRIGNKEIVSLIGTVGVAGGGAYGGDPAAGLMAGLALQLITSGKTKAGLGMALNRAVKYGGGATAVRRGLGPLLIKGEENEQIAGER